MHYSEFFCHMNYWDNIPHADNLAKDITVWQFYLGKHLIYSNWNSNHIIDWMYNAKLHSLDKELYLQQRQTSAFWQRILQFFNHFHYLNPEIAEYSPQLKKTQKCNISLANIIIKFSKPWRDFDQTNIQQGENTDKSSHSGTLLRR